MKRFIEKLNIINKEWKKIDNYTYYFYYLKPIISILKPIMMSAIPKIIIDSVNSIFSIDQTINKIVIFGCLLAIVNWIEPIINEKLNLTIYKSQNYYIKNLVNKLMTEEYSFICSPNTIDKIYDINRFMFSEEYICLNNYYSLYIDFISCLLGIFSYLIVICSFNKILFLVILPTTILDIIILKKITNYKFNFKAETKHQIKSIDYLSKIAKESENIKELFLFNFPKWFIKLNGNYSKIFSKKIFIHLKKVNKLQIYRSLVELTRNMFTMLILINDTKKNNISISTFVFLFLLFIGFENWICKISEYYNDLKLISNSFIELINFLYYDKRKNHNIIDISKTKLQEIEFINVSYIYPNSKVFALKNINLKIKIGDIITIVGENGSGKSTLINLICGLLNPTSGKILINGINLNDIDRSSYYKLLSIAIQNNTFFPDTIKNNIVFGKNFDREQFCNSLQYSEILNTLNKLELKENSLLVKQINKTAVELSGGEMQKIKLAKTIYKDSPIMIFDEPTSALDPITEKNIYDNLSRFRNDKITIFISHRLSSAQKANKIILLSDGLIKECGTHNELIKNNYLYKKMFDIQSYYYTSEENYEKK